MANLSQFKDFIPKENEVLVGTSNVMVVKELSVIKRNEIVNVIFESLNVVNLLKPIFELMEAYRERKKKIEEEIEKSDKSEEEIKNELDEFSKSVLPHFLPVAGQVESLLLKFFSNDMSRIACIILDVDENRKVVGIESKVEKDKESGFEYNPAMFSHIERSLTPKQEQAVFREFLEVNDFSSLIKNYWTLVTKQMKAARDEENAKPEKMEASQPSLQ